MKNEHGQPYRIVKPVDYEPGTEYGIVRCDDGQHQGVLMHFSHWVDVLGDERDAIFSTSAGFSSSGRDIGLTYCRNPKVTDFEVEFNKEFATWLRR